MRLNDDKPFGLGEAYFLNPETGERIEIGKVTVINFVDNATVEEEPQTFVLPKSCSIHLRVRWSVWQMFNWMTCVVWRRTK